MPEQGAADTALALARQTRAWTVRNLAHDGLAPGTREPWRCYLRSSVERVYTDTWYDASQLLADAALARLGDAAATSALAPTVRHLLHHWDAGGSRLLGLGRRPAGGGFLGRGGLAGDWVGRPDKYADDNALVGVALLAAGAAGRDAAVADECLARAVATAEYLIGSGLWDDTFGGGFWWNTRRGDSLEGKPAQSNGLAALLFLRLHAHTGEARWREWAARTLVWCEARLWDEGAGLYRYCVRYAEPAKRRGGPLVEERFFNYDQGILIECLVEQARAGDAAALGRARTIAAALEDHFWDADVGGFVLEAGVPQVLLVYAAWLTPSLLALYAADPDPRWLSLARRNHDALHARLHDSAQPGAYAHQAARDERGRIVLDATRHTAAQAWMQHAQAALAAVPRRA